MLEKNRSGDNGWSEWGRSIFSGCFLAYLLMFSDLVNQLTYKYIIYVFRIHIIYIYNLYNIIYPQTQTLHFL